MGKLIEASVLFKLFFPSVAVPVRRQGGRHFRREVDVFRRVVPTDIHQGFFMMLSREEHVERRNDEQREDGPYGHPADENETD